jgi:hypothetical protein
MPIRRSVAEPKKLLNRVLLIILNLPAGSCPADLAVAIQGRGREGFSMRKEAHRWLLVCVPAVLWGLALPARSGAGP